MRVVSIAILVGLLALATSAGAAITSSSGSPRTSVLAGPFDDVSRNLQWSIRGDDRHGLVPATFSTLGVSGGPIGSTAALQVIDRQLLSTGGSIVADRGSVTTLGSLPPLAAQSAASAVFSEQVSLPRGLIEQARRTGARRILIVRTFVQQLTVRVTITGGGLNAPLIQTVVIPDQRQEAVALYLTPQVGGPFSVFRAVLRFDDGAPFRMVRPNEPVRAFADLYYRGTGRLEGVWEIAEVSSTSGSPVFRPLERVVRMLAAGQRVTLRGPRLPNLQHGLYLLRFRIQGPAGSPGDPVIRYQVLASGGAGPYQTVSIATPPPEARVDGSTRFAWSEVDGAVVYRMEFFEERPDGGDRYFSAEQEAYGDLAGPGAEASAFEASSMDEANRDRARRSQRVTGLLLPASEREARLTELAWEALVPGRAYWWRVVAVAEDGSELGSSELQRARVDLPAVP